MDIQIPVMSSEMRDNITDTSNRFFMVLFGSNKNEVLMRSSEYSVSTSVSSCL